MYYNSHLLICIFTLSMRHILSIYVLSSNLVGRTHSLSHAGLLSIIIMQCYPVQSCADQPNPHSIKRSPEKNTYEPIRITYADNFQNHQLNKFKLSKRVRADVAAYAFRQVSFLLQKQCKKLKLIILFYIHNFRCHQTRRASNKNQ